MDLKDLMAISGQPGLFRFLSQGKNSIIVEQLETRKRTSVFGSSKMSSLEEISIYTEGEDMSLSEVFDRIHKYADGEQALSHKSDPQDLKDFFEEVIPEYDKDRVYVSDIKKMVQWYNLLHRLDLLIPDKEEDESREKPDAGEEKVQGDAEDKDEQADRKKNG